MRKTAAMLAPGYLELAKRDRALKLIGYVLRASGYAGGSSKICLLDVRQLNTKLMIRNHFS